MKRFRKLVIAALTAALLLLQTVAVLGADWRDGGSDARAPRQPAPQSFPSDPGEPDPVP